MEDVKLHHGDAAQVLPGLASESIDALVTDPPWGIGFNYSTREAAADPETYWGWLEPLYREALRCVKPGGFVAVWQSQRNFRHLWDWFGPDIHIYAACKNFVQLRRTPINAGYDPVVMFFKPGAAPLLPRKLRRNLDFFVANTACVVRDKTRLEKGHPCPRPLDAVLEVLNNFVVPGGVVLDPFAGSGTTAVATLETGRRFVGCEINEAYHALALRRIVSIKTD